MYPFSKDDNRTVVAEHRRPLTALRREYPHLKIENFQITIDGEIHSYYRLDTAEKDLRVARHRFCLKQYGHIESVKASLEKLKKEIQK